ncbi:MAG: hypothetical protein IPL61_23110 [Myxococcales bacterium]|nr:hypothetical protein [Myxococcales bacterium]
MRRSVGSAGIVMGMGIAVAVAVMPLVTVAGCGGPASSPRPRAITAPTADAPDAPDAIVASWAELRPRLHAIYRGQLAFEPGLACASDLRPIDPADAVAPARLCTPLAEVVAWQAGLSVALPTGPDLWIATSRDADGHERVAAAAAVAPGGSAFGDAEGAALTYDFRCGQLTRRWQVPAADLGCAADIDCRLFASACFTAVVAERAAAPYQALHQRWGGPCLDPAGGMCAPTSAQPRCVEHLCTLVAD